jgi:hypothetical protein
MDGSSLAASGRTTVGLRELARAVVERTDPQQRALFDEVTAAHLSGRADRRRHGRAGGSVGSGFDHVTTAEVVYQLLAGACSQVLGTAVVAGARRRWWRRRRAESPPLPLVTVTLDRDRLDELHAACVGHGMALGLSRAKAKVLADAVHGRLAQLMAADEEE